MEQWIAVAATSLLFVSLFVWRFGFGVGLNKVKQFEAPSEVLTMSEGRTPPDGGG